LDIYRQKAKTFADAIRSEFTTRETERKFRFGSTQTEDGSHQGVILPRNSDIREAVSFVPFDAVEDQFGA
jgi:hypothetical protein